MGEMDILPEDPTDHSKKQHNKQVKRRKKWGDHSFIHTNIQSEACTHWLQMRKRSKLFQLHFKRYSFF